MARAGKLIASPSALEARRVQGKMPAPRPSPIPLQFIAYSILVGQQGNRHGICDMIITTLFASLAAWIAALAGQPEPSAVRRVVIQDEVTLRIPVRPLRALPPQIAWTERKGPKCLDGPLIAGAALSGPSSIDFIMIDRTRVRAEMDDKCPALDFYGSLYVQPKDDRICVRREEFRSRMGGSCRIKRFRTLKLELKR